MGRCGVHYTLKHAILDDGNDNRRGGLWLIMLAFLEEKNHCVFFFKEPNLKDYLDQCGKFIPFPKLFINKFPFLMSGRLTEILREETRLEKRIFS